MQVSVIILHTVKSVLRDHCQERPPVLKDHILLAESLHFNATQPVTKDHLSWETIFLWPMGRSFKRGCNVLPFDIPWFIAWMHQEHYLIQHVVCITGSTDPLGSGEHTPANIPSSQVFFSGLPINAEAVIVAKVPRHVIYFASQPNRLPQVKLSATDACNFPCT